VNIFGVFRVKNHDFTPKIIFFPILGGVRTGCAPLWIRPCNQCLSPLMLWVLIPLRQGVLNTTLCDKMNCKLMLTYDTPALRQTGSTRNLTGQKTLPTIWVPIWSLCPNIRCLPSIVAEKNATKNGHIQNVCSMCIKINKVSKQEVGIWCVQKRFPRYGVHIWSLWPNIRSLPSIVAKKNVHICSMCIKTN
jgi:hypothetical protein